MANIGSFKKSGSEFQGEIVTLSVQTKNVRIVPESNRANDNAPSHRVYVGRAEIGAAGRSAPTRAATISRSSWTIRASTRRSTLTSSTTTTTTTTRTATATPSSGPAPAGRTETESTRCNAPPGPPGGVFACTGSKRTLLPHATARTLPAGAPTSSQPARRRATLPDRRRSAFGCRRLYDSTAQCVSASTPLRYDRPRRFWCQGTTLKTRRTTGDSWGAHGQPDPEVHPRRCRNGVDRAKGDYYSRISGARRSSVGGDHG